MLHRPIALVVAALATCIVAAPASGQRYIPRPSCFQECYVACSSKALPPSRAYLCRHACERDCRYRRGCLYRRNWRC
jgi:hypothetical protein